MKTPDIMQIIALNLLLSGLSEMNIGQIILNTNTKMFIHLLYQP